MMGERSRFERFLEIIPGSLVWLTFGAGLILSFFAPLWVIYFIIIFDLYWLLRVLYFIVVLLFAWRSYRRALKTDWFALLKKRKDWEPMLHAVFLPMVSEDESIADETLASLTRVNYPLKKFIIVLAGEERAGDHFTRIAERMKLKYGSLFHSFLISVHPDGLPDEIRSKGANINYAGHQLQAYLDEKSISYDSVIVSAFDIDTIAHPEYFACLTETYLGTPDPTRHSYQPVVLYNNNMWSSPAPMRLAALSTTFWLMSELARPDRLFTFSSHSMSFRALVDVGFWAKDIVSEDSRIFLQCFIHYGGQYAVKPLYIPVSMDTVMSETVIQSLKNLYKQQRRWAWGVEHFPFMVQAFRKTPSIPLRKRFQLLLNQAEGMYTWATAPLIILVLGRLPVYVAEHSSRESIVVQNAPLILEILLNMSMVGILVIGLLSFTLMPPQPASHPKHRRIFMVLQWLLLPISLILFSAFPAIDAQTRLMLGKYLGFNVTQKKRV